MIEPPWPISGNAFWTVKIVPFTFVSKVSSMCSAVILPSGSGLPAPALPRNVDVQFAHDRDILRPHGAGFRACALHIEPVAGIVPQQSFRHLAACGVCCAENQDSFLCHCCIACSAGNQCLVRLHAAQTDNMTGTSTKTPTTVANAAPDSGPNSAIAVATASSKKFDAPISAPGAATECSTLSHFIRPYARPALK